MMSSPKATRQSRPANTTLRIVNINFRSVKCKKEELLVFLEDTDPDVVMGTETWLMQKTNTAENISQKTTSLQDGPHRWRWR